MRQSRGVNSDRELNVVPMMNLFVVLVPMLLLSAVFVQVGAIQLAGGADGEQPIQPPPVVRLTQEALEVLPHLEAPVSHRFERDDPEALARLTHALGTQADSGPDVIVSTARDVRYQDVVQVIDACARAGFHNTSLAAWEESAHVAP